MCGFAGIFDTQAATAGKRLEAIATAMANALAHRGPDDAGAWVDEGQGIALGHRRLKVIDLTKSGSQPMISADGRFVIAYNGEIYNFSSVRKKLEGNGTAFRGTSDTEVLVNAIATWGLERALDESEGMFAVAVWDRQKRVLYLARDRFGEKPLYYGWANGLFAFASELKALREIPGFNPEIDRDSIASYLRHNCIPAPRTAYRGIRKLAPGQYLQAGPDLAIGRLPEPNNYWSAAQVVQRASTQRILEPDPVITQMVEAALSKSVAMRMVADVALGAFLSGGIDSSLVVALMQANATGPIKTFTIGFDDPQFDESVDAGKVAAHLGTDHTMLKVTETEAMEVIPRLCDTWDEPFADSSQIPTMLVSQLARSAVTVALSGDGGDELFAGYNRHAVLERLWNRASKVPAPVRRLAGSFMARVPPSLSDGVGTLAGSVSGRLEVRNPSTKLAKISKVLRARDPQDAYLGLVSHWDHPTRVVRGASADDSLAARPETWPELSTTTDQLLWLDLVGYLPDDVLTKVDRAGMAVSLETRIPFLDRQVMDLAWRLPLDAKLRGSTTKWVLRQVLYRHVPPELVERPKMGFGVPVGAWIKGRLRPWAEDLLDERRLSNQGLLDPLPVRRAWKLHLSGRRDLGYELWDILMLQSWVQRWMPTLSL